MKRWLLVSLLLGCVSEQRPEDVARAYAEAVRKRDAEQIWALSDEKFKASHDKAQLEAFLAQHPEHASQLAEQLNGDPPISAEVGPLVLVREGDVWRIRSGGVEPYGRSTPEGAVQTFFLAVEAGRFDVVRTVMPASFQARFERDDALAEHLRKLEPRIVAARAALSTLKALSAQVEGDEARLPYADGRAIVLVREEGAWKVLDLE